MHQVSVRDEHNALGGTEREMVKQEALTILKKHPRLFGYAHLSLHVRTSEGDKNLTRAVANLVTDNGRFDTSAEAWSPDAALQACLLTIKNRLRKQQEKHLDRSVITGVAI